MVGVSGFEPPASCSQSRRANQAALHPDIKNSHYQKAILCAECILPYILKFSINEELLINLLINPLLQPRGPTLPQNWHTLASGGTNLLQYLQGCL